jgi:large subunit ribosomal protein L22
MESKAIARFARVAPRKARTVIHLVRGRKVSDAIDMLLFTRKSAATIVRKVIESALANAKQKDPQVNVDELYVSLGAADKGPTGNLRRWRPRAMGRATRIEKGVSHIAITLTDTAPTPKPSKAERRRASAKGATTETATTETATTGEQG